MPPETEVWHMVAKTLEHIAQGFAGRYPVDENWRIQARREAARALAAALRRPPGERQVLRTVIDQLPALIEVPLDVHRLRAFKNDLEWLQAVVARPRTHHAKVLRLGNGTSNFHRVLSFPDATMGLLGTALTDGAEGAIVSGVLAGALAVAQRGMGNNLGPAAVLTILDRALKDTVPDATPLTMCAWWFERGTRSLRVSSAGHRGLWLIRRGTWMPIRPRKADALGAATRPFREIIEPLERGDLVLAFTPGLFEQENLRGDLLQERDLRYSLLEVPTHPERAYQGMVSCLEAHCAQEAWYAEATAILWEVP